MSRASSIRAFREAVELLRSIDPGLSLYVAGDTLHLMHGPSHDDRGRPQRDNVIDSAVTSRDAQVSGQYGERAVREFLHPNAFGQLRTVELRVNDYGRWTWWIYYPELPKAHPTRSDNYFDSEAAARRSARRFLKKLGQ